MAAWVFYLGVVVGAICGWRRFRRIDRDLYEIRLTQAESAALWRSLPRKGFGATPERLRAEYEIARRIESKRIGGARRALREMPE